MTELEKINILVVDDNEDNLTVLEAVLDSKEYNLIRANSGLEAVALASCHDLACILLDVQMPGMDGFETAARLRVSAKSKEVPIIFVTAIYSEEAFVHQGYESGAVDYIFKPFNPSILRSKVAIFVDLYRKTQLLLRQSELLRQKEIADLKVKGYARERAIQQKYRDLIESIEHCIVWSADPQTRACTFVSPRAVQLTGYTLNDWFAKPNFLFEHVYVDDRLKVEEALTRSLSGDDCSVEHRFTKNNGEVLWFHTSLSVSKSEDGTPLELRGLAVDVTDIKNAVEVRDQFLSIASHELLTPITSLKLQLQMLKKIASEGGLALLPQEKSIKMFERSDRQLNKVTGLIENLLNVSRINLNHMNLEMKRTDLRKLIQDVTEQFCDQLEVSGNSVELDLEDSVVGIWDPFRLEQVVVNLLTNAIKYGNRRPIKIIASANSKNATLTIKDHGIGISPDDQKRIFGLFERAVSANNYGGLGLGLYIVKNIVDKHSGKISVASQLGEGSAFTVELPLKPSKLVHIEPTLLFRNEHYSSH